MLTVLSLVVLIHSLALICPVLSCEEDCMDGVTAAFFGNYSSPLQRVFRQLGTEISEKFLLDSEDPKYLLEPINKTFYFTAHNFYRNAIFPSHFHGKCQNPATGVNPSGCPNPSCPVVCGTPGSLAYHYSDLRIIVHNATKVNYEQITRPSSLVFSQTLSLVQRAMKSNHLLGPNLRFPSINYPRAFGMDENSVNRTLSNILRGFSDLLDGQCGGYQSDPVSSFPLCNWRRDMIAYMLTFP
ncbi:hypothetical protein AN958_09253 [Leucoagaricus sp. SymC.cos]|nr:hypothetical protein AN958_09253 [Leucoagaricus sp. SymC.cos]